MLNPSAVEACAKIFESLHLLNGIACVYESRRQTLATAYLKHYDIRFCHILNHVQAMLNTECM